METFEEMDLVGHCLSPSNQWLYLLLNYLQNHYYNYHFLLSRFPTNLRMHIQILKRQLQTKRIKTTAAFGTHMFCIKKMEVKKKNLEFKSKLVERLIQSYHSDTNIKKSGRPKTSGIVRLTERHFPSFVPPTPKKEAPTRYCAVCCAKRDSKGKRKRKESRYMCNTCNVGLCAAPCFEIYHTKENFK